MPKADDSSIPYRYWIFGQTASMAVVVTPQPLAPHQCLLLSLFSFHQVPLLHNSAAWHPWNPHSASHHHPISSARWQHHLSLIALWLKVVQSVMLTNCHVPPFPVLSRAPAFLPLSLFLPFTPTLHSTLFTFLKVALLHLSLTTLSLLMNFSSSCFTT